MKVECKSFWSDSSSRKIKDRMEREENRISENLADERFINYFIANKFKNKSILDLGAGGGRLLKLWDQHNCNTLSLEWSDALYPILKKNAEFYNLKSKKIDISSKSFRKEIDQKFDLIFCTQFLLHIHPLYIQNVMDNINSVSKKDVIIITYSDEDNIDNNSTSKTSSFSHNYEEIFKKNNWNIEIKLDLYFDKYKKNKLVTNKIYVLSK